MDEREEGRSEDGLQILVTMTWETMLVVMMGGYDNSHNHESYRDESCYFRDPHNTCDDSYDDDEDYEGPHTTHYEDEDDLNMNLPPTCLMSLMMTISTKVRVVVKMSMKIVETHINCLMDLLIILTEVVCGGMLGQVDIIR
ncbi:hypothetical protein KY290_008045 [Solanum tuberosum]|uniref:Uncharacterized protein n=1 Tax=Solanum tuberosum TaxID=4113 RepID=A0ABQ7W7F8_SOLTU|nr:hypothetical protein KY290_008045 [Solanum tuberosum]